MKLIAALGICLCLGYVAHAQPHAEYRVPRATEPPKIDGILDDAGVDAAGADADRTMGLV